MREIRTSGSEGGAAQSNASSLPLSSMEADYPIVVSEAVVVVEIERGKNMEFRNHAHLADRNKRLIDTVLCVNYNTWRQI